MKIAFFFGSMKRGGAERVIASLANTFCAQGDEVHIITKDNGASEYPLDERVRHVRLGLAGKSANKLQGLMRNVKLICALRRQVKAGGYDAVVTMRKRGTILLQYAFPFGRRFRLIASERANPRMERYGRLEQLQYDLLLPRVDGFIFQTERVSHCFSERLRRIGCVIHNGVFEEILPAEITPFAQRRQQDICAVGRLAEQKGYDLLLQAFAAFGRAHPAHRLHIYGEGALRPALEKQIAELGLQERVILHGNVLHVMHQVADMGMFVMASRYEGMPNALMEAMACGLPCISADCDFGPAELISDHENGLLTPVEDVEALARAMAEVADDPALAQRLSANAVDIRRTHSGQSIAAQYRRYIADIVSGR